jgi:hypothetical protein
MMFRFATHQALSSRLLALEESQLAPSAQRLVPKKRLEGAA